MKIIEKDSKIIKTFEVDYENGIKCEYTTTNGKLTKYSFSKDKTSLTYVENIDELRDIHWSKHYKNIKGKLTITKIKKFQDFDKLFYVGGGYDGKLMDKDGNHISTPLILDDIFFSCWMHLETKKEKCQKLLDSLKKEYIVKSEVVEIPGYNWRDDKKHHYTLNLTVKLTDELYNNFMKGRDHLDDTVKVEIVNFLKS